VRTRGGRAVLPSSWIIVAFWIVATVSTVVAFAISLISRVILALYIAIGPLLIGLALFPATRSIFERWIGWLISPAYAKSTVAARRGVAHWQVEQVY
jgi:type IV secretory pathway VirB6-like protein